MQFELEYRTLVTKILNNGELRDTRNGVTRAIFGEQLKIDISNIEIPLLLGRRIYHRGIFGEFSAFMHNAKSVEEFEKYGCNYWQLWADASGRLELDYSEQLFNFNGVNQLQNLITSLKEDPKSRRHIISLWRPDRFEDISLHCCHYAYQFYVDECNNLHMLWNQRSVDVMVGLPSDIILAWLWVKLLCAELGYTPGTITMSLGDCHIYEEHTKGAMQYCSNVRAVYGDNNPNRKIMLPTVTLQEFSSITDFMATDIEVDNYLPYDKISFELKA